MMTFPARSTFPFIDHPLSSATLASIPLPSFSFPWSGTCNHKRRIFRLRPACHLVPPPASCNQPRLAVYSLLRDETGNDSVAGVDPSLLLKKKAVEASSQLKGASIFLTGMNNKIKTDAGKILADSLRYYYFDSDSLVEEAAGSDSTGRSFKDRNPEGFLLSETELLKQLSSMGRLVVCAGDGAVSCPTNLALLRYGISIWIDVPLDIVSRGCSIASESSNLGSPSEVTARLVQQYEDMRGGYSTADATVSLQKVGSQLGYEDLGTVTAEDMALEVLSEIHKLVRFKVMMEEAAKPF